MAVPGNTLKKWEKAPDSALGRVCIPLAERVAPAAASTPY